MSAPQFFNITDVPINFIISQLTEKQKIDICLRYLFSLRFKGITKISDKCKELSGKEYFVENIKIKMTTRQIQKYFYNYELYKNKKS